MARRTVLKMYGLDKVMEKESFQAQKDLQPCRSSESKLLPYTKCANVNVPRVEESKNSKTQFKIPIDQINKPYVCPKFKINRAEVTPVTPHWNGNGELHLRPSEMIPDKPTDSYFTPSKAIKTVNKISYEGAYKPVRFISAVKDTPTNKNCLISIFNTTTPCRQDWAMAKNYSEWDVDTNSEEPKKESPKEKNETLIQTLQKSQKGIKNELQHTNKNELQHTNKNEIQHKNKNEFQDKNKIEETPKSLKDEFSKSKKVQQRNMHSAAQSSNDHWEFINKLPERIDDLKDNKIHIDYFKSREFKCEEPQYNLIPLVPDGKVNNNKNNTFRALRKTNSNIELKSKKTNTSVTELIDDEYPFYLSNNESALLNKSMVAKKSLAKSTTRIAKN